MNSSERRKRGKLMVTTSDGFKMSLTEAVAQGHIDAESAREMKAKFEKENKL